MLGKVVQLESKPSTLPQICERRQPRRARAGASKVSPLTPELKEFIDRAIVPALVDKYIAQMESGDKLAVKPPRATHSHRKATVPLRRQRQ